MSEVIFPRSAVALAGGGRGTKQVGEPNRPVHPHREPPSLSPLILTSIVAPLVGGPLGSVMAIVFGWAARRELHTSAPSRGRILSTIGMALGLSLTVAWGAALAYVVVSVERRAQRDEAPFAIEATNAVEPSDSSKLDAGSAETERVFPKLTTSHREGSVTVVDIGASVSSLAQELAKQRAEASSKGEVTVVMTTRAECHLCARFNALLAEPLMQTALSRVRLVRIDAEVFDEDLTGLKIPHERAPGFYLLAPDLFPRDGIDDAEWDADVAANIAPVLGAFVRGKYEVRRQTWRPVMDNGMRL